MLHLRHAGPLSPAADCHEVVRPLRGMGLLRRVLRVCHVRASYGGPERETLRNLPVPVAPPPPGPPPPPPPPPPPSPPQQSGRRELIISGVAMAVGLGLAAQFVKLVSPGNSGVVSGGRWETDAKQLEYVGGQLGLPGMRPPVRPAFTKDSNELVGLIATAPDGTQFLVRVDADKPSRLLLKSRRDGQFYGLETNVEKLDLGDRGTMETIFRTYGWEKQLRQLR